MKFLFLLFFISACCYSQTDSVGSGRAIQFDGVDDYIEIGSHYHDLTLPITASVWIKFDPSSTFPFPLLVTNDNTNFMYRGFWFYATNTMVYGQIGDGAGGNNPAFRKGVQAFFSDVSDRWVNLCVVMRSPTDVSLYLNGVALSGNIIGDSNLPMAKSYSNDTAKIGYQYSNAGSVYRSKAIVDEVRLWNRALTQDEVRQNMCKKLTGNESGLVGYWNFDETTGNIVFDKSPNHFDGKLKFNPQRVFSGAPIGDVSTYQYSSNWSGTIVSFTNGGQELEVSNINGSPEGVQIYEVKSLPSQTGGLNLSQISPPYFGIFMAGTDADNTFNANLSANSVSCSASTRSDNSVASWVASSMPLNNVVQQIEMIPSKPSIKPDLGNDLVFCNQNQYFLDSHINTSDYSLTWSTGEHSQGIIVTQSGFYWLDVTGCNNQRDSIYVSLLVPPQPFSFGPDESLCRFEPRQLKPLSNPTGFSFQWQDGSTNSSFDVKEYGIYWVEIKNICGSVTDTLQLKKPELDISRVPNVITPNGDSKNDFYVIQDDLKGQLTFQVFNRWGEPVFRSNNYSNDWDGGDLTNGVYYLLLTASCIGEFKTPLTIVR